VIKDMCQYNSKPPGLYYLERTMEISYELLIVSKKKKIHDDHKHLYDQKYSKAAILKFLFEIIYN